MEQKAEVPAQYIIDAQDEAIRDLQRRVTVLLALLRDAHAKLEALTHVDGSSQGNGCDG